MTRTWAMRFGGMLALTAGLVSSLACGGGRGGTELPGAKTSTPTAASSSSPGRSSPTPAASLTNSLLQASFPGLKLNQPGHAPESRLLNGPQLSDQQLAAGAEGEVAIDFGGKDADSSVAYDLFPSEAAAKAWYQRFTLGFYRQYVIHGTYTPKGIDSAKCEQFADTSAGRNSGGTQCFALDRTVVAFGESIVFDTPSGNQQDAEALLKAALSYLDSVGKH